MKTKNAIFTILGCGSSTGVPIIGNDWRHCNPEQPRNRRTRASALISCEGRNILIDFGPDISNQLTRENVRDIHAILLTHVHGDHVNGVDDLRILSYRLNRTVPVYGKTDDLEVLAARFPYALGKVRADLYPAVIDLNPIDALEYVIENITLKPFLQDHGSCQSLGFRFGNLAYSTDMRTLSEEAISSLQGIEIWIADGGAYNNSNNSVHADIEEIIRLNGQIKARQVYITHMTAAMDYDQLLEELPSGYAPAYDGLQLSVQINDILESPINKEIADR